ncbi:Hypothetical predicted protein [Podarcis lilfordi]|uniref:Uncharacterized protein n=1 Tax=Podarcis lilfordi TaxID=74358 RepID=A0AA35K6X0_9SAUR|nr:Hypothetical predicted protein [Podarcis lilfordi]
MESVHIFSRQKQAEISGLTVCIIPLSFSLTPGSWDFPNGSVTCSERKPALENLCTIFSSLPQQQNHTLKSVILKLDMP